MPESVAEPIKKSFSLSQLAENFAAQVSKTYSSKYWIRAEIGKLNYYPQSGHAYPQLLEKKNGAIVADLRGFIAKMTFRGINERFKTANGQELKDGMQILMLCKFGYHPVYGLSLQISDIDPSYTLGEMARLRQEAIQKLKRAQLFELNKSQPLSLLVRKLAVISVETSKGYHDFQEVIHQSKFANSISTTLFPALLQGDAAVTSIQKALQLVANRAAEFDAVTIIRGGGGETGLDCYDQFSLAEAVCKFPLPVLTGIGHATNLTVVEQVAFQSFLTPTHFAQFLIQRFEDFQGRINTAAQKLSALKSGWFAIENNALKQMARSLEQNLGRIKYTEEAKLQSLASTLHLRSQQELQQAKIKLEYRLLKNLEEASLDRLENEGDKLIDSLETIEMRPIQHISTENKRLTNIAEKLRILDPVNTLKRGFSISKIDGKAVLKASELKPGDEMTTTFWNGSAISTIKEKSDE